MDKLINSPWPLYSKAEIKAVSEILRSGKVNYWTGSHGKKFEDEFSFWSDCNYSIALANGTVALELSLKAIGLKPGDEVIVTPRSFIASVSSVVNLGAKPIFADIDHDTGNISRETIKKVISSKTKAVICVHLSGWPCDIKEIVDLCKKESIYVIEDCAQAHGALIEGQSVGSFGDIGAWSFCQDKIMTTGGEGGMVTTNNKNLWATMWSFKDHGKNYHSVNSNDHPPGFRWLHDSFGSNYRMTEIQAILGRMQLKKMELWTKKRTRNALRLQKLFEEFPSLIRAPKPHKSITHAFYRSYAYVRKEGLKKGWTRDRIFNEINNLGVPCFTGACPEIYLEKAFENLPFKPKKRLKNARLLGETSLAFLVHPTIKSKELDTNIRLIRAVLLEAQSN